MSGPAGPETPGSQPEPPNKPSRWEWLTDLWKIFHNPKEGGGIDGSTQSQSPLPSQIGPSGTGVNRAPDLASGQSGGTSNPGEKLPPR